MKRILNILFFVLITKIVVGQPFPFNGDLYYINTVGATQRLIAVSGYTNSFNSVVVCTLSTANYNNGLAANPVDGYLYYIGNGGKLYKLDKSGNTTPVCTSFPVGGVTGCFDNYGRFIFQSGLQVKFLNINTCTVVKTINSPPGGMYDLIFNPKNCSIYCMPGLSPTNTIYQMDTNGVVTGTINTNSTTLGKALALGKDGKLHAFNHNGNNNVTSTDLSNGNTITYNNVLSIPAVNTPYADGASFIRTTVSVSATSNTLTGCAPLTVNFNGSGVADSIINYSWNFGDGGTSLQQNPVHTFTTQGTYTVTLTLNNFSHFYGPCGFTEPNTTTLVINVTPGTPVTCLSTPAKCFGSNDGTAMAVATGTSGPFSYLWSNGSTSQTASSLGAGTHTVIVTDINGCTTTTVVNIAQPTPITPVITTPGQVCVNQNSTINSSVSGGTSPYTYLWQPGSQTGTSIDITPTVGGTVFYSLNITDANNCTAMASNSLIAYDYPSLIVSSTQSVCIGGTVALSATGAYSYFWSNGVNTSSTIVSPLTNTTFTLTGYNEIGCASYKTVDVLVNQLPNITITNVPNASCLPLCLDLKTSSNSIIDSYAWVVNNEAAGHNSVLNNYCFDKAGINTIKLNVTDNNGCSNSTQVSVETYPKPHAYFEVNGVYTTDEPEVTFTDNSWDDIKSHFWYFGDGTTSTINNPVHVFKDEPVTYKTFLVVKNIYGCADTAVREIKIEQIPVIYVPNAFTPNADGLNDIFYAKGIAITDFKMMIFDRWGEKIFESNDISNGWDGTIKGKEIKNDTYTWTIDYSTYKVKASRITGHVTLMK